MEESTMGRYGYCLIPAAFVMVLLVMLFKGFTDLVRNLWWRPLRIKNIMEKQGIRGPAYHFLVGNMMEIKDLNIAAKKLGREVDLLGSQMDTMQLVVPFFSHWMKLYGKTFMYWFGPEPNLFVMDPEMAKEILSTKFENFEKPTYVVQIMNALLGQGLVTAVKEDWENQRRIVRPAFHYEKLKAMLGQMVASAAELTSTIAQIVDDEGGFAEVEMRHHMKNVTADIIARTAFGSSYQQGKRIFEEQLLLNKMFEKVLHLLWIPGFSYFPTANNRKLWRLHRKLESSLKEIVQARLESKKNGKALSYGNDLLGLIVASSEGSHSLKDGCHRLTTKQLIDECKTFFFAGQETTECLLAWALMFLSLHPSWQDLARQEVYDVCQGESPEEHHLSKLKILGMILYETARLFPPVISMTRVACKDLYLGNIFVPKGLSVEVPIIAIHVDQDLWGKDALDFKPERFADGVANACNHPQGFMPFSMGPRKCLGQTFALMEAKVVLVAILQRFTFCLSTSYRHNPASGLLLYPRHGMQLIMETL